MRLSHETSIEGVGVVAGPLTALWLVTLSEEARGFMLSVLLGAAPWDDGGEG